MAGMMSISVRSNVKEFEREIDRRFRKQMPFAVATALNKTAARVGEAETENIRQTFEHPTPFTQKSVGVRRARKSAPIAIVFMKDIAASYLLPYEVGGVHKLNSRALLNPKDIKLNQYGQLSRGTLAALRNRPDIFIGAVKTANGTINGVWQRPTDTKRVTYLNARGKRLGKLNKVGPDGRGHLKLLIRFGDALPVKKHLNWGRTASQVVSRWFDRDLAEAFAAAKLTAR
ncbi:hypothetical protein CEJ98_09120 [Burkholderia gladioli pv. gladioli]|nr:hypothetical protein CEJ98_09120 [Burkholderia gladioli pv. gladioli]AWY55605.1 hypothetical protein A8H28_32040 [Burkholderia gladioli pv. gladioli]